MQALNAQQLLVLSEIYPTLKSDFGGWTIERLFGKVHDCPSCPCVFVANPERKDIEEAVQRARQVCTNDPTFRILNVTAHWGEKGQSVLIMGRSPRGKKIFIGQWHLKSKKDLIPSYDETLLCLRKKYLVPWRWAMRVVGAVIAVFGICLFAPCIPHFFDRTDFADVISMQILKNEVYGEFLLLIAGFPIWFTVKRWYELFGVKNSRSIR
jgi:hypothetical protein